MPSNAPVKTVTWSTSNSAVATVANGVVTAVAPGTATIRVTTTDGGKTATCTVTVTDSNLKTKFGVNTANDAFTALHNLIQGGGGWADQIALGDYIDLPSLTIAGSGMIADKALSWSGPLLRLIVVGVNSFKRDGAAANNPGAPDHVVFQFRNIPVRHNMNDTATNADGYASSGMRTYLMGDFLTGLKTATGLTDSTDDPADPMLWAPLRKVANGGSDATGTDDITDTLWLPTEWEMFGASGKSSQTYEATPGQARLEYYTEYTLRKKYSTDNTNTSYWLASPSSSGSKYFCLIYSGSYANSAFDNVLASEIQGCAPAFCVQ